MSSLDQMIDKVQAERKPVVQTVCACGERFNIPMPQLSFINYPTFSTIIATHERFSRCPKCSQVFGLALMLNEQSMLVWNAVTVKPEVVDQVETPRVELAHALPFSLNKKPH